MNLIEVTDCAETEDGHCTCFGNGHECCYCDAVYHEEEQHIPRHLENREID